MKKLTRVCLILTAVFLVLGLGLMGGAVAMGAQIYDLPSMSFGHGGYDNGIYHNGGRHSQGVETGFTQMFSGVDELDLEVKAGTVTMTTSESATGIEVLDVYGNYLKDCYMDGNTLKIDAGNEHYMFDQPDREIRITFPEHYQFQEVSIEVMAGEFIGEDIKAGELEIDMKAGSAEFINGDVKEMHTECSAGQLVYQGTVEQRADADCKAGSIEMNLHGEKTDFNYSVLVAAGSITVGEEEYSGLSSKHRIAHDHATGVMDLECSAGSIEVYFE